MKPSDCLTAIKAAIAARAPLYLWGAPGVGKTSVIENAAASLNLPLITLRANLLEPVDVLGLPVPNGDQVKWLSPDFIPRDGQGILFIDEFAQAPIATQCALMRLVDNLPAGWVVIAASNRTDDRAGAGQVATHVLDRFTHIDFDVSREDWQKWAVSAGVRPEVRAFIDFRPGLLFQFEASSRQKTRAGCSPRSWHRASRILETAPDAIQFEMLSGTIGAGAAAEFRGFLRVFADCPSPDAIIGAPDSAPVPREPSALFAVCAALADRAKTLAAPGLSAIVKYIERLPIEFGALLITDLLAVAPTAVTIPAVGAWIVSHQAIFAAARK